MSVELELVHVLATEVCDLGCIIIIVYGTRTLYVNSTCSLEQIVLFCSLKFTSVMRADNNSYNLPRGS